MCQFNYLSTVSSKENATVTPEECGLMRLQRRAGMSYSNISENLGHSIRVVATCVRGKCNCDCDVAPVEDDAPWREPQVVKELFIEDNLYFTEMANLLDCHPETARNWVIRHDVSPVPSSHRTSSKVVRKLQRLGALEQEKREQDGGDEFTNTFPGAR
jgi:hypothetical protein